MEIECLKIEIAKLKLAKDDTLVVRIPFAAMKHKDLLKKLISPAFPKTKTLILPNEIHLEVIESEEPHP